MSINIRKAENSDREAILAISAQIWGGTDYIPNVLEKWMQPNKGILWVAETDGIVAGFSRMTFLTGNRCWMEGIRVDPAKRGKGIGKHLTHFQLEEAKRRGFSCCALSSYFENHESLQIIKKHGFEETARFKFYEYTIPSLEEQDETWQQEQLEADQQRKAILADCTVSQLGVNDWALIEAAVLDGEVIKARNNYISYDWTFECAEESFLEERLAAGDFYLLNKQNQSTVLSLSSIHAKGNYHTLNFVSNLALEAEAVAFALNNMHKTGEPSVNYMAQNNVNIKEFEKLGFYVFNEEALDTFVFERKGQEA